MSDLSEDQKPKPPSTQDLFATDPPSADDLKVKVFSEFDQSEIELDPFIGKTIGDKYEVLSALGKGGMSTVYKAKNKLLDTTVALKVLHKHLWADRDIRERFKLEAKAVNQLVHQNLVTLKDYGVTDDGEPYLVMDYLEGEELAQHIKENGGLPLPKVLSIFIALCEGLSVAHKNRIVHRDIKPANVMFVSNRDSLELDRAGIKLVDFGIAKIVTEDVSQTSQLTQTGEVFGSPLYMSPEQCLGEKVDNRTDVYSLGCLIYEAVTGRPPLIGNSALAIFNKQVEEMPEPFAVVSSDLASRSEWLSVSDLEYVVFKCLEKNREDRYQSVDDILVDLRQIENKQNLGKSLPVRPSKDALRKGTGALSGKRKRLLLWSVATVVAIVLGASASLIVAFNNAGLIGQTGVVGPRDANADANNFDKIAYDYYLRGEYRKAIPLLKFGVDAYDDKKNPNPSYLADNSKHIGNCYMHLKEYDEAAVWYQRAYNIYTRNRIYNPYSKDCMNEYASVLEKLGRANEARIISEKARSF